MDPKESVHVSEASPGLAQKVPTDRDQSEPAIAGELGLSPGATFCARLNSHQTTFVQVTSQPIVDTLAPVVEHRQAVDP